MNNIHNYSLEALNVPSEDWLGAFYRPTDTLCIRVFADKKGSDYFGQKITCVLEEFPDKIESLMTHNQHGRGIFNVVNQGGHDDASITRITAHYVEMDDVSLEKQPKSKIKGENLDVELTYHTENSDSTTDPC